MRLACYRRKGEAFIGIDGGGTKTECIIGDAAGSVYGTAGGPASNMRSKSLHEVKEVLIGLIRKAAGQTGIRMEGIHTIYLSLAGSDRPEAKKQLIHSLRPAAGERTRLCIEHDAAGALAAGTWGGPGTVLIAGTGSIAYARYPSGKTARVGGWGYLLGDEGSGFDIGRKGLSAVLRAFDGRGEPTVLTSLFTEKFQVEDPGGLIPVIYNREARTIADLAKDVFAAAKDGDVIAEKIVRNAVDELLQLIQSARTSPEVQKCPLVISGGLFMDDFFKHTFTGIARRRFEGVPVIHPAIPPAAGAYILALASAGIRITDAVKTEVQKSLASVDATERSNE